MLVIGILTQNQRKCSPICYNTYGRYHEHFRDHVMENCKKLSKTQKQHDREKHKLSVGLIHWLIAIIMSHN